MNITKILQEITKIEKQLQQLKNELLEENNPYKALVYCHILPNNKYYIGTTKNTKQRWLNGEGYRANTEFYRDIKKYGWENVEHLILYECLDIGKAEGIESYCISLYGACSYGYNKRNLLSVEFLQDSERRAEYNKNFTNMIKKYYSKPNNEAIEKINKIYIERGCKYANSK